jgi:hypothetical protein
LVHVFLTLHQQQMLISNDKDEKMKADGEMKER